MKTGEYQKTFIVELDLYKKIEIEVDCILEVNGYNEKVLGLKPGVNVKGITDFWSNDSLVYFYHEGFEELEEAVLKEAQKWYDNETTI